MVRQKALIVIIPLAVAATLGFICYQKFLKSGETTQPMDAEELQQELEYTPAWDDLSGGDVQDGLIVADDTEASSTQSEKDNATPPPAVIVPSDAELLNAAGLITENPLLRLALSQDAPLMLFVQVLDKLACGESPTTLFGFIGAFTPFRATVGSEGYLAQTKETSSRFDSWVDAFVSIPPKNAAEWYLTAEPRLQALLDELGYTDAPARVKLTQALETILQIPNFDFPPELVTSQQTGTYEYRDKAFSELNDAQKAIVRLGFGNCAKIKAFAKNIAKELKLFR